MIFYAKYEHISLEVDKKPKRAGGRGSKKENHYLN